MEASNVQRRMDKDLTRNPFEDEVDKTPKGPSLFVRLVRGAIDTIASLKPKRKLKKKQKRSKVKNKYEKLIGKQNEETLANLRRVIEAQRQSRSVRGKVERDMGTILRNADERRREARKKVQMAIRRSTPWVSRSPSPFE